MARRPKAPRIPIGSRKEERERLKPRLGGPIPRDRPLGFHRSMLRGLAGAGVRRGAFSGRTRKQKSPRGGPRHRGWKPPFVAGGGNLSRRVIVKAHYHSMDAYGAEGARLHLRYIQRDGVGEDGQKGVLYDRAGTTTTEQFLVPLPGEQRQFRFVISPEDGDRLNLTDFTRRLMAQVEKDLGRQLLWSAANHYNTDNPHTHVVVRGVDAAGQELWIPDEYLKRGMRGRASEIATEDLGLRTTLELEQQLDQELGRHRLTSIDRDILSVAENHTVRLGDYPTGARERARRRRMLGRLQTLERMGLARSAGGPNWQLADGWDRTLKDMGEQSDIIKRMHAAVPREPSHYRIFPDDAHTSEGRRVVEGIIRRKGLHDEQRGVLFAVVESPLDGKANYVRMSRAEAKARREGEFVRVTQERDPWLKPADRRIVEIAAAHGGVYTPAAHRAALQDSILVSSEDGSRHEISAEDFVASHVRRLRRLAYLREVNPAEGDTWRIPPNLLEKLAERDKADPRTRVVIHSITRQPLDQQRQFRGPTWLDTLPANDVLSPDGLGAETASALQGRRLFLRNLGLDPSDRQLQHKLRKLERDDRGRALEARTRRRYAPEIAPDEPLTGKLQRATALPSGQRVMMVVDSAGGRFTLLPARKEYGALEGQVVSIRASRGGRISVSRPRGRSRDE